MRRVLWLTFSFALTGLATLTAQPPDAAPPADKGERVALGGQPAPDAAPPVVKADDKGGSTLTLPDGSTVKLVNREKMRAKPGTRSATIPRHLKGVIASLPIPPPTYDYTKNNTVAFPVLGNNQVGDCYYAAGCHIFQAWNANVGTPITFNEAAVIARYRKLSGGDNGLSDYDVFGQNHNGEFYGGIVGPNGPHKILDHMTVDPADEQAMDLTEWAFGGHVFTCALCNSWLNNSKPGALWDKGTPNPNAGHAIILTGKKANGNRSLQTWGFNPPIEVTRAGILSADPEVLVCFSLEWFDPQTGKAPNGLTYQELADLWHTLGGRQLPPSPFVPPTPVPPVPVPPVPVPPGPAPVPGAGFTGSLNYVNGTLVSVTLGNAPAPAVGLEADLKAAGVSPAIIADVLQLIADIRAKKGLVVIVADLMKIMGDVSLAEQNAKIGRVEPAPPPRERFARRKESDHTLAP